MPILPLLADPDAYRACESDLLVDEESRAYWINLFAAGFQGHIDAAVAMGQPRARCEAAAAALARELDLVRSSPDRHGTLDILVLDRLRRQALDGAGLGDVFRDIKARENDAALAMLADHLAALDAAEALARVEAIVVALLAGNFFDLGAEATAARYAAGGVAFEKARSAVPPRPWRYDDLDLARNWLSARPPRRAVLFADNAGPDAILGLLPLARHLLALGAVVVLAANARPSLNDVTAAELRALVTRASAIDPVFRSTSLAVVDTGGTSPLIDLADVSDDLCVAARAADLVVLIGMGRAVESNWTARLTCACWRIAMIKDPQVAKGVGAAMYDAVVRFEAGR